MLLRLSTSHAKDCYFDSNESFGFCDMTMHLRLLMKSQRSNPVKALELPGHSSFLETWEKDPHLGLKRAEIQPWKDLIRGSYWKQARSTDSGPKVPCRCLAVPLPHSWLLGFFSRPEQADLSFLRSLTLSSNGITHLPLTAAIARPLNTGTPGQST